MAYKISDACISCGACAADCPVELSQKAAASTKSMEISASIAEHALRFAL